MAAWEYWQRSPKLHFPPTKLVRNRALFWWKIPEKKSPIGWIPNICEWWDILLNTIVPPRAAKENLPWEKEKSSLIVFLEERC